MADERDNESSATVKNILDDLLRKIIEEEINNFLLQQNNLEGTNVKIYKITYSGCYNQSQNIVAQPLFYLKNILTAPPPFPPLPI